VHRQRTEDSAPSTAKRVLIAGKDVRRQRPRIPDQGVNVPWAAGKRSAETPQVGKERREKTREMKPQDEGGDQAGFDRTGRSE